MEKIQLKYEDRMTVAELRAALDGLPEDDFIQVYSRKFNESVYITEVEKVDDDYTYLISNDEAWSKNLMSELSTVDALEAQPTDAVSREEVIENVIKCTDMNEDTMEVLENKVRALPSVIPQIPIEDLHREKEQQYMLGYEEGKKAVSDWYTLGYEDGKKVVLTCEDAVSRKAVIKTIFYKTDNSCDVVLSTDLMDRIKHLPPVQPQRKKGKWRRVVDKAGHWVRECDCKWQQRFATNYCPDCGAEMSGGEEDGEDSACD